MFKCNCDCNKSYQAQELIACTSCSKNFYFKCASFTDVNFSKLSKETRSKWRCSNCKNVKKVSLSDTSDFENMKKELLREIRDAISLELKELKTDVMELRRSVDMFSSKIDEYNVIMEKCKTDNVKILKENQYLKGKVAEIETQLFEIQQYSRANNLEIHGIPVTKNEDIFGVLKDVAKCLKVDDDVSKIDIAHRLPVGGGKEPPIIVKFTNRTVKNNWLSSYKNVNKEIKQDPNQSYKQLQTTHVNRHLRSGPVFINENLSPYYRNLFYHTKQFAKEHKFKYAWIKNGKIFIRKEENSRPIRIFALTDLGRIEDGDGGPENTGAAGKSEEAT